MPVSSSALKDLPEQDYASIRNTVRTGDLALCCGDTLGSRLIRWATGTPWSHVAMLFRLDEIDRVIALEAVERIGVRVVPLSRFVVEDSNRIRPYPGQIVIARHADWETSVTPERLDRLNQFSTDRLGAPFSRTEVMRIAARYMLHWANLPTPPMVHTEHAYICSEYIELCFRQVGIEIPRSGRGFATPGDIAAAPQLHAIARVSRAPFPGGIPFKA